MRVKFLKQIRGSDAIHEAGDVADVDKAFAFGLIAEGAAEPETAMLEAPERAVKRRPRPRKPGGA